MAINEDIARFATVLQAGLKNKVKVKTIIKNNTVKQIVKILESRNILQAKVNMNTYELTVTASEIHTMNNEIVKAKNILNIARAVLPSISGVLIVSTSQGVMEHELAHQKNLGGRLLLGAY